MEMLSVRGLTKQYPAFALEDVGFTVEQGEIMGLIGRNGAGKTTTLKCLLNQVHPDQGEVNFFGLPLREQELEIKRRIGFASGGVDYYLRKPLSTITDVTRRFYSTWDQQAYQRYITLFALDEKKTPSQLSAGMKVKYNLALALSHHAELLLLDEPTSGLDPVSREDLLDVFLHLAREGVSILFSTHITSDLEKCADRITYIHAGRVAASESLETYVKRYRLVDVPEETLPADTERVLIGKKLAKHGYTALVRSEDAHRIALPTQPADLDAIMVHMEKEGA